MAGNQDQALQSFMTALGICSNYEPAYHNARHFLEERGEKQQVAALDKMFGTEPEPEPEAAPTPSEEEPESGDIQPVA